MQSTEIETNETEQQKPEVIMNLHIKSGQVSHFRIIKTINPASCKYSYRILAGDRDIDGIEASNNPDAVVAGLIRISGILGEIHNAKDILARYNLR